MYNEEFCNQLGIKVDKRYINRTNNEFGYAYIPDARVKDIKNKIKQNPNKYSFDDMTRLSKQLDNKSTHPSALEEYIIILLEVDKNNLTKFRVKAEILLKKFHECEYNIFTNEYINKLNN